MKEFSATQITAFIEKKRQTYLRLTHGIRRSQNDLGIVKLHDLRYR